MNYYELEAVRQVLEGEFGIVRASFAGRSGVEVWTRVADGHTYRAALAWEAYEFIVSEDELTSVADALRLDSARVLDAIRAAGGLYLGPSPQEPMRLLGRPARSRA